MDPNYCCPCQKELIILCEICPKEPQNPPCICQMDFYEPGPILGKKLRGGLKPTILTGYKRQELLEKQNKRKRQELMLQEKLEDEKPISISDGSSDNEHYVHSGGDAGDRENEENPVKRVRKRNQFWFDVAVKTRKLPGYAKKIGDKCNCQNESSSEPSTSSKESIVRTTTFLTRKKLPQASISFFRA